ncbi:MAG: imidazolonepropionase [Thermoprotei archaeon]|nr:imidazolonepropionase [Thermoprotei archaeon]
MKADLIIYNIGELVSFRNGPLARVSEDNAVIVRDAGIAVRGGVIVAVGRSGEIRSRFEGETLDAQGLLATPGLVDPHTHLVFAGSREDEFNLKLQGVSYSEILARGGGIYRTVKATLEAGFNDLLSRAAKAASLMLSHGTTTVEVKSGYALSLEGELKMLKVVKALGEASKITVIPTLLAHVPPREYRESSLEYARHFAEIMVPAVSREKLAVYVDVFCDRGAFNVEESRIIIEAGLKHGLRARMHADQLAYIGCSKLAAELPIDSLDHLEKMPEENARILAEKGVTAVLTPTSIMAMMELKKPPIEALRKAGVTIAVASDYNPNNMTPLQQTAMDIAPYILNLTPLEALAAATVNAAKSLNMHHKLGSISEGYRADIVLWELENYKWIGYMWGYNKALAVLKDGIIVHEKI